MFLQISVLGAEAAIFLPLSRTGSERRSDLLIFFAGLGFQILHHES
jgi:hypothetical protein